MVELVRVLGFRDLIINNYRSKVSSIIHLIELNTSAMCPGVGDCSWERLWSLISN